MKNVQATSFKPAHFGWSVTGKVATISLNRPERKNPLTFDRYVLAPPDPLAPFQQ